jgi:hypothetical protein
MVRSFFLKIKYTWKRFYRIQNVKRRSEFVWNDLIKYNLEKVGVLDNMKLKSELKTHSVLTKLIQ